MPLTRIWVYKCNNADEVLKEMSPLSVIWVLLLFCYSSGLRIIINVYLADDGSPLQQYLQSIDSDLLTRDTQNDVHVAHKRLTAASVYDDDMSVFGENDTYFFVIFIQNQLPEDLYSKYLSQMAVASFFISPRWLIPQWRREMTNFSIAVSNKQMSTIIMSLVPDNIWREAVIFYDNTIDRSLLSYIPVEFSSIGFMVLTIDITSVTKTDLSQFMIHTIKKKIRFIMIYSLNVNSTMTILKLAANTKLLQPNYFWIIINAEMALSDLQTILTSDINPNIAVINPLHSRDHGDGINITGNEVQFVQNQYYNIMDTIMNVTAYFNTTVNNSMHSSTFRDFSEQNERWKTFQEQITIINVFVTKSYDLTPSVPNIFTYSTIFQLSLRYNLTDDTSTILSVDVYPNIFRGWNNKTIYICSPEILPTLIYLTNDTLKPLNETMGVIPKIVTVLARQMNFVPYFYQAPDKQWGALIPGSFNYTGCIGEIFNKKALFGASDFTVNVERSAGIDFTVPFMEETNSAVLQYPKPASRIWTVFRPLELNTWLLICGTIMASSLFCYVLAYFSPLSAWNLGLEFAIIDEIRLREHIWNIVGSFFMQGQDFYPYSMSSRTVLAIWWLFSLIIFSAYSADLTSFLTVMPNGQTIVTLAELSRRTDLRIVVVEGGSTDVLLQESNYPIYQSLYSRIQYVKVVDDCPHLITYLNASNLVCMTDTSPIKYVVARHCSMMYIIPETFDTAALAFPVQNDAPFKPLMDFYIRTMVANGQVEKWLHDSWTVSNPSVGGCDSNINKNAAPSVDFEGVSGIFIITIALIICSLVILAIEVIWIDLLGCTLHSFIFQS